MGWGRESLEQHRKRAALRVYVRTVPGLLRWTGRRAWRRRIQTPRPVRLERPVSRRRPLVSLLVIPITQLLLPGMARRFHPSAFGLNRPSPRVSKTAGERCVRQPATFRERFGHTRVSLKLGLRLLPRKGALSPRRWRRWASTRDVAGKLENANRLPSLESPRPIRLSSASLLDRKNARFT